MAARRTVLLLQDLLFGGTQRHALELARRIDRRRFAPEFWMLSSGADFAPQAREADVPMRWLSDKRAVTPGAILSLRRELARSRPDILMPLTAVPNIWGRVFGRLSGVPAVLATCRGGGNITRQHERFLARLAHHHIANTRALKDALVALGRREDQVTVIPNGVDTDFFTPDPDGVGPVRQVILCVARFVEDKDHQTLLAAFDMAWAKVPGAELWLVGDGPLKGRVEFSARRLASHERIKFFPGGSDLRPFYRQAAVLTLSSLREGLPNVILEGMASGAPIAATAVGGIPEVVEEGVTGLLSPVRDASRLAGSFVRLLSDEDARARMAREARAVAVRDYSMAAMVARHEELLDRLASAPIGAGQAGPRRL
ncbi:glycosyltransferase [Fundidesulfovibrio terrae]|uniref:glycosyltransferase n=1 Tax=Fundidesulfovibrio terrae TaxID=2922866 RepID=UPI001FAE9EA2|nr:glycosyltransferase [Fundidesulfovibrio terrae]